MHLFLKIESSLAKTEPSKASKEYTLGTFLDMRGAFDKIKFEFIKSSFD